MELNTQRILLRQLRQDDFAALKEYEGNSQTYRFEKNVLDDAAIQAHIDRALAWSLEHPRINYYFAITLRPEDIVRGQVSLCLNFSDIREWEIGWRLHYQYWGKGYATEAAGRVLAFAFEELGAHRVVAFCNVQNLASVRVMEKLGMLRDGRLRETRWWNGSWQDEFVYAILERDWESQRKRMENKTK